MSYYSGLLGHAKTGAPFPIFFPHGIALDMNGISKEAYREIKINLHFVSKYENNLNVQHL